MAALILNEEWNVLESERPDFIVTTPSSEFGLEVTECHAGRSNKKGSELKRGADARQRIMNEIREDAIKIFPQVSGWALSFFGPWTDRDSVKAAVMKAIKDEINGIDQDCSMLTLEEHAERPTLGFLPPVIITQQPFSPPIRGWQYMPDRAGNQEISSNPLQAAIDAKAAKLSAYKHQCKDIRLLVSANSLEASGKVSVDPATPLDTRGFDAVYFLCLPFYVVEYPSGRVATFNGHTPASLADALRLSKARAGT
jgi:hypothetical protein